MASTTRTDDALCAEARRALAAVSVDAKSALALCARLIEAAERRPSDEPPPRDGAAALAGALAKRCLDAPRAPAGDPAERAYLHMALANALRLCRDWDGATPAYAAALDAAPERGWWWFNLGLLHKARGEWREALQVNRRARELLGDEKAVLWNLAIAATALGDGASAVEAMRRLGHAASLANSGMPSVEGLGPVQVRAATVGAGIGGDDAAVGGVPDRSVGFELLWVSPLSPVHGVVSSATWREASVDYGDVVLWDGVPLGVVEHEGRPVPRFPLLSVLRRGDERRFRFLAREREPGALAALAETLPPGARLFVHRERMETLCAHCAQATGNGDQPAPHTHAPLAPHRLTQGKICVPGDLDLATFRRDFDARMTTLGSVVVVMPGLLEAVGDTAGAGKAHRMWLGLERAETREHA